MADTNDNGAQVEKRALVRYGGIDYPMVSELTEREKFEAERMTGVGLDEIKPYTSALVLAFFTLKRAAVDRGDDADRLTWDWLLDSSGFEFVEGDADPLLAADAIESESVGETTENSGDPGSPTPSGSVPAT